MPTAMAYNRPVHVRHRYADVARVEYLDTHTVDYVPVAVLDGVGDE